MTYAVYAYYSIVIFIHSATSLKGHIVIIINNYYSITVMVILMTANQRKLNISKLPAKLTALLHEQTSDLLVNLKVFEVPME